MKNASLASAAVFLALTPPLSFADQALTLYGRANLSLERQAQGDTDTWRLQSNASRLGVKGELDLDMNSLKGVYQAEFGVSFDQDTDEGDGDEAILSLRNTYAGFRHDALGMLIAGKFDTPLENAQGEIDQFDSLRADISNIMGGENRPSNIVRYRTPTFANGLEFNLALILGEDKGPEENDAQNGISSSIVFELDNLYGALAYDKDVTSSLLGAGEVRADTLRAVVRFTLAEIELGALAQQAQEATESSSARDTSYLLSAAIRSTV